MTSIEWDPKSKEFLEKLPKFIAQRIFKKVDNDVKNNVTRFLETLVNLDGYKIRVGITGYLLIIMKIKIILLSEQ